MGRGLDMESKYEYGVGERNDGLYVIYRKIRGSNIYEYLYNRNINQYDVSPDSPYPQLPRLVIGWTSHVGNAYTSLVDKNLILKTIEEAKEEDIEFERLLNGSKIKRMMDVEEFKNL
jgi:hypothetical protein